MPFKWEKLTVKSQQAVQAAASLAAENGNPEVLPMHLLAALLDDREGVVLPVLEGAGVRVQQASCRSQRRHRPKLPRVSAPTRKPAMAASCKRFWTAPPRKPIPSRTTSSPPSISCSPSPRPNPIPSATLSPPWVRPTKPSLKALSAVPAPQRVTDQNPEGKFQALEKYGKDLTDLARKGKLEPRHRPRRRDPAASSRSSPAAPKKPRPQSRARVRQDGHRSRPRPRIIQATSDDPQGQSASSPSTSPA